MPRYLLSIYQPDGPPPPPEVLEPILRDMAAVNAELHAAGAWVFAAGLQPQGAASVIRTKGGKAVITDGPFTESKEHLGGFTVIEAADYETALDWGAKLARAITLPIEVRPLQSAQGA
jgi:hypothetical protein